jgi:ferredoxin-type protein NapG
MAEEFNKERREFLKQSVLSVGKTVYEYYEQQKEAPVEVVPTASPIKARVDWLRPPGAVEEKLSGSLCQ